MPLVRRERDIESAAVRDARSRGWLAIKVGFDGWPDRLFITHAAHRDDARHVWVEYKRPGQNLTALQERKHAHLREQGAEVYVCHSTEETREVLGE